MYDFDEYKRLGEPEKSQKSEIWQTAIGLQQVDGLTPSKYLIETAKENIEGYITLDEVKARLNSYYKVKISRTPEDERTEEADKVSAHIAQILSEKTFSFSPAELISIHKRLFDGIYKFAGIIRDYNIAKDEWVLDGDTVIYAGSDNISRTLDYDFAQEKAFDYRGLTKREKVEHIADFISRIWQVHPFGEGNTRTVAVFAIKYLRAFGFNVTNELFSEHSWYFHNALVRANYNDYTRDIFSTQEYLNRFFSNLLLGEKYTLRNRDMLISIKSDSVNTDSDSVNDSVNARIVAALKDNPKSTAAMLSDAIGVSVPTINRRLKKLKINGIIDRIGSDKTGYWQVK